MAYDLFITKINENNIIKEYSIYQEEFLINIDCIVHLKVQCEEIPNYTDNYKLIETELVELTDEEKEANKIDIPSESTTEERITKLEEEKSILAENVYQLASILEIMLGGTEDGQTEATTTDTAN